ncbi:MAG: isoprenylcysteine carboxylmethyltransferase family protein [Alistipes sp.]|nr:isoprenylcysteine carboxylmethyltransferase family protein [Alistipes sp.]
MGATATIVSSTVFLIGYLLYFVVMKQNEWLSRTVEVAEGQQVVTTGLYGIVRHPMYMATLLMFLAMPVVLGSWWALGAFVFYIPVIVVRTLDEERLLRTELKGYSDYCRRVRWRILPYIW